jgi:hypothetical protein
VSSLCVRGSPFEKRRKSLERAGIKLTDFRDLIHAPSPTPSLECPVHAVASNVASSAKKAVAFQLP